MSALGKDTLALGIDLGTTNTALAYVSLTGDGTAESQVLPVPQVTSPGVVEARPLLPSFCYLPHETEFPTGSLKLPWDDNASYACGVFARGQGVKVPGRLVSSAKSWLGVSTAEGPHAAILPWGAPEGVTRVSPVEASTRYLKHVCGAFDAAHGDGSVKNQPVVLTVPASFDAGARDLTVEAARNAGLENLTLLEEPQAAVYAWLSLQGDNWRKHLKPSDVLLVVDVGGGTSDFSLISVAEENGNLSLQRVAVGDHILLGGDNMDLALAYALKARLESSGKALDAAQLAMLCAACRDAKETLFARADVDTVPIAVAGRGSSLMAGTLRTELDRKTLLEVLVDGFFPLVTADARPAKARRAGLTTLGLPYAQDAGITRHLAEFLGRQVDSAARRPGASFIHPTCVLFNGGVFKAGALQSRILEVLNGWLQKEGSPPVRVLEGQDLDHAVARGAAAFGRFRARGGVRIRGGTARAYYVGIELAAPAVPGVEAPMKAVCVAPFGMEEGTSSALGQDVGLFTGEPVRFRFFTSTTRREDKPGAEVADWKEQLTELPSIEATATGAPGQLVPVSVQAHVTTVGTLELTCQDKKGEQRARFEFNARAED